MKRINAFVRLTMLGSLFLGLFVGASAGASTTSESASLSNVTATYSYAGTFPQSVDSRLKIERSGVVVYDQPVTSKWCGNECWPDAIAKSSRVVHVVRLRAHGSPDVVLDLYTGGAHCCSVEQVFYFDAMTSKYVKVERNFGDPGARLEKLGAGGSDDFVTANDAFAYEFTDFAASGLPIEILQFSDHSFQNVTRSFPALIAKDAKQWLKAFNEASSSHYSDTVGVVAAWAADEDLLGHTSEVTSFLNQEVKAGRLNSALSPIDASGEKFVLLLQKFLERQGYRS